MNNLTITIDAPALCAAINALAQAIGAQGRQPAPEITPAPAAPVITASVLSPTAQATPVVPTMGTPPVAPTVAVPVTASVAPPAPPAAPTATPTYDLSQLAVAAAAVCDAGQRDAVIALLQRYGVQQISALAQEHYGAFATELRTLGARI